MNRVVETIVETRLIGIVRMKRYEQAAETARALAEGGIRALEFALSGEGALKAIAAARDALGPEVHLGAGTVLTPTAVVEAASVGAEFIVTPVLNLEVIRTCQKQHLPVVCGAFTPTEIWTATDAGADLVKLFPARLGGPQYVRDLLAPLPALRLVPTGGVSAENARDYLEAGAAAVAIGGGLVSADLIAQGQFSEISRRARQCVEVVSRGTTVGMMDKEVEQ